MAHSILNPEVRYSIDSRGHALTRKRVPNRCPSALQQSQPYPLSKPSWPRSSQLRTTKPKPKDLCLCNSLPLKQIILNLVALEKEKSIFGSKLQQIQRIASLINHYDSLPLGLREDFLRLVIDKQLSKVLPGVGKLVTAIVNTFQKQQPKMEQEVTDLITMDINEIQKQLDRLQLEETQIKNSKHKESVESGRIVELRDQVERQNLELVRLRRLEREKELNQQNLETRTKPKLRLE